MTNQGSVLQIFWAVIGFGLCGYGLFTMLVYFFQERLLYYPNLPSRSLAATPARINLEFDDVLLTTSDKVKLHGWFVPAPIDAVSPGVVLFFHGNAGNISHRLDSIRIFHDLGQAVFIVDYRGYGRSSGKISEQGTYLDAEAAWLHLTRDRDFTPSEIVIFGRSLGGAIATELAGRHRPRALIVESAFTSVPDLAATLYPFLPVRWLSRYKYDTLDRLAGVVCPVLVAHSRDDDIIPFSHGRRLFDAASPPKRFLELEGDHNQGFLLSGRHYVEGLQQFLQAVSEKNVSEENHEKKHD